MVHLIKNEALSAPALCIISHLHLSSTLSPTSLCVGATISRILRHPNRSEIKRGFWDERIILYYFLLPKRLNNNIVRNWSLQLFMMILFSFPTTNNIFIPMSRVEKIPLDFFSVSQSSEWYRHPLIFYAVVLFCQLFMHWVLIDILDVKTPPDNDLWREESESIYFKRIIELDCPFLISFHMFGSRS